jgi:CDP-diacylglycerol--glycerol-3-phosphate 3-phosphatidyltransferase
MKMTFPMILTLMRIALIPVLVLFFYLPYVWAPLATAAVFIFAAITDWLDGYLARRMGLLSAFGAFLDPVADS